MAFCGWSINFTENLHFKSYNFLAQASAYAPGPIWQDTFKESIMIKAVKDDYASRFKECQDEMQLCIANTGDISAAMEFHKEVEAEFGITDIMMDPLSLNVSCHIGPGALALACARKL